MNVTEQPETTQAPGLLERLSRRAKTLPPAVNLTPTMTEVHIGVDLEWPCHIFYTAYLTNASGEEVVVDIGGDDLRSYHRFQDAVRHVAYLDCPEFEQEGHRWRWRVAVRRMCGGVSPI